MQIEPLSDAAILVTLGQSADEASARCVRQLAAALNGHRLDGILDIVPAYRTIGVHYDPIRVTCERAAAWVESCAAVKGQERGETGGEIVIPVCYGGEFGPDLGEVAWRANISPEEVVALHSGGAYSVRAVGFMPGFAYLAGLDSRIHSPRRATPRTGVPAGSVGIGGEHTGVYPVESPGGWQLIGRTPLELFCVEKNPACRLAMGDRVRFEPIAANAFRALSGERRS